MFTIHWLMRAGTNYICANWQWPKRIVFLGMNPGPFGMVQTGVPFGEINAVRNWLESMRDFKTGVGASQTASDRIACALGNLGQRLWDYSLSGLARLAIFLRNISF